MSDPNKPDMSQIPLKALEEVAKVFTYGCSKEGRKKGDWQHVDPERFSSALIRHLGEHQYGNVYDSESGYSHLAHAACNAIICLWHQQQRERTSEEIKSENRCEHSDRFFDARWRKWFCKDCGEHFQAGSYTKI